jgi:hypothetical protein
MTQEVKDEKKAEPKGEMITLGPDLIGREHNFVYKSATEVKCTKCPLGYPITPGTEARDGHIYIHGQLLI